MIIFFPIAIKQVYLWFVFLVFHIKNTDKNM